MLAAARKSSRRDRVKFAALPPFRRTTPKIAAVCGTTCEQYQDLSKAIAGTPDKT
jgi:hypothetical protein